MVYVSSTPTPKLPQKVNNAIYVWHWQKKILPQKRHPEGFSRHCDITDCLKLPSPDNTVVMCLYTKSALYRSYMAAYSLPGFQAPFIFFAKPSLKKTELPTLGTLPTHLSVSDPEHGGNDIQEYMVYVLVGSAHHVFW